MDAKQVVMAYWQAMQTNDFYRASEWLSEDFYLDWPQSAERIVGRHNFALINTAYPSSGKWHFQVNSVLAENESVVTDVTVSDENQTARAITFHWVENGLIYKQLEYWPDDYQAPQWRAQWVQQQNL
ncbi:MAG: nuclear transport factor 2 family protein [Pseudomonadales bacterium]|nr:nuclear transport factor 2 family protein [Pseudomonadales bacterium]